jgi:hypothetical protein
MVHSRKVLQPVKKFCRVAQFSNFTIGGKKSRPAEIGGAAGKAVSIISSTASGARA